MPEVLISLPLLRQHDACELGDRVAEFEAIHGRSPEELEPFRSWLACPRTDGKSAVWALRAISDEGQRYRISVLLSCSEARAVLHLAGKPGDRTYDAALNAIVTSEGVLKGTHTKEQADAAAYAAVRVAGATADTAAAWAVYAAFAAAYAAFAAYAAYAAFAAGEAAYAAAAAARAAARAANADTRARQLATIIRLVEEEEQPNTI